MKKLISVLVALAMILSLAAGVFATDGSTTIYFDAAEKGWTNVNAYCWNDSGNAYVSWPGAAMTNVDGTVWSYEVPAGYSNIIFNNGSSQTGDLTVPTDGKNIHNGTSWGTLGSDDYEELEMVTLYVDVAAMSWSTAYAYAWEGSTPTSGWPGDAMTLVEGTIYSISIAADTPVVIFNNGNGGTGNQTDNLNVPTDGTNMWDGSAWTTYTAAGDDAAVSTAPEALAVGDNAYEIVNDDLNALSSSFTATEAGVVTINPVAMATVNMAGEWEDVPAEYIAMQFGRSYSLSVNGENVYSWPATVEVNAGDVVAVALTSPMGNPVKVTVNVGFEAAQGDETENNVLVSVTDESVGADAPWTYTFTAETTGTLNIKNSEGLCYKIFGLEGPDSESLRYTSSKYSAGTEADYRVEVPGEITVKVWAYNTGIEVDGKISCTLTFTPDEGEQEVVKEEYFVSDIMVGLGENTLTLDETAITTIYEFCPDETGLYKFTVNNAWACVGYWGAGSFFVSKPEGELTNSMEAELTAVGQSIMVGIFDVEGEFVLTIEKVGSAEIKEIEWEVYENYDFEYVADIEIEGEVIAIDVTDDIADNIYMDDEGFYRYGSVTGPIVVVNLVDNGYINIAEAYGYGQLRVPYSEEYGMDYNEAVMEYYYADQDGTIPATFEIMMMIDEIGASKGWYDPNVLGFYPFGDVEVDPATAHLCFFGYVEGTEMVPDDLGYVVEGEFAIDEEFNFIGEMYVTVYPAEDGVITVEIPASTPGYMVLAAGVDQEGNLLTDEPLVYQGEGDGYFTFDVEAGYLYAVIFFPAEYSEEYEEYMTTIGSVSYVVTYDKEAVTDEPEDEEKPEPVVPEYYVTGEGELFGNWAADNANGVMTESADGVYKFTLENVPAGDYKFKVTDGTWDKCWGDPNSGDKDGNFLFSVKETSDVTITFNSATGEIAVAVNGEEIPKTADMSIAAIAVALMAATAGAVVIGKKKEF